MKKKPVIMARILAVSAVVALFSLVGCAEPVEKQEMEPLANVGCVAVLPVSPQMDLSFSAQKKEELQEGSAYATGVINSLLTVNPKARLVGETPTSLNGMGEGGKLEIIREAGKQTGCQAVLFTSLERYSERKGGEMSVDTPASASFDMTLFHLPSGRVLWVGDYEETQESFLANIFSSKMKKRGFRWITVEELVGEALEERLAKCPYLK